MAVQNLRSQLSTDWYKEGGRNDVLKVLEKDSYL